MNTSNLLKRRSHLDNCYVAFQALVLDSGASTADYILFKKLMQTICTKWQAETINGDPRRIDDENLTLQLFDKILLWLKAVKTSLPHLCEVEKTTQRQMQCIQEQAFDNSTISAKTELINHTIPGFLEELIRLASVETCYSFTPNSYFVEMKELDARIHKMVKRMQAMI